MTPSAQSNRLVAPWFRRCLLIAAGFNGLGAAFFAPPVYDRSVDVLGLPPDTMPFALWTIASWIAIFGLGYGWMALRAKPEPLFIAVAAACKLSIATIFVVFWQLGSLPAIVPLSGLGDVLFAIAFLVWLQQTRSSVG